MNWPDDFINKVICADCMDILPQIPKGVIDAVITDPPYNIGFKYDGYKDDLSDEDYIKLLSELRDRKVAIIHYPEEMMKFVVPALGVPKEVMAWCYNSNLGCQFRLVNFYNLQPEFNKIRMPYKNIADKRIMGLMANGSQGAPMYDWFSDIQQVKNVSDEKTKHPCQIPEELMSRLIVLTTAGNDLILDPFCGSGTTLVAAKQLGRRYIGIEISPEYCKIAEDRLRQTELFTKEDI